MLEINILRNDRDRVIHGLIKRNLTGDIPSKIDQIVLLDEERKATQTQLDGLLAEVNALSAQIGQLYKSGNGEKAGQLKEEVTDLKQQAKLLEIKQKEQIQTLDFALLDLPNVPHDSVPAGHSEADNELIRSGGQMPEFGFEALPHWDLAARHQLIDFQLGVKLAGSGFPLFRKYGAMLQRALVYFFLQEAWRAGYEEISPPLLVNADTARATGQLPDKEGQMYHIEKDELYLIPTAEVPVTNILRGQLLEPAQLPIKLAAYTPCFRREAGSYGADVKGLNRVHQFDKVEIVQVTTPDKSYQALDEMVAHVEGLLNELELPYRIVRLCGGDLGFTSALTYDFEVYAAAQKRWLEVSSVSNFETYQSNRLKLRYRKEGAKPQLLHTLNGSALALARVVAALLENNQDETGIRVPEVLQSFMKIDRIN